MHVCCSGVLGDRHLQWMSLASDTGEDPTLPRSSRRQSSLSWCSKFTQKMALKWVFSVDNTGGRLCTFIVQVSWDIMFFWRMKLYSDDGLEIAFHWSVTLGKTQHPYCSGFLGDRVHLAIMIGLLGRGSWYWCSSVGRLQLHSSVLNEDTAFQVGSVLMRRWVFKWLFTSGEDSGCLLFTSLRWQSFSSQ